MVERKKDMSIEFVIVGIVLIIILLALIVILMTIKAQGIRQHDQNLQLLMKNQEIFVHNSSKEENMSHQFDSIVNQIQTLRKEQAASWQTLDSMSSHIETMNRVMTNTKARGNWGEYQLEFLLKTYAGNNPEVYSTQYKLENGKIADAILRLPGSDKVLCIDSKFPMENYSSKQESLFASNVKKHIQDIADKYITLETMDQAILFLPSEAIYQHICASHEQVLNYALSKHVLLTSPTTLIGVIFTLLASTKDFYRATHMEEIEKNILLLQEDVERLVIRADKAKRNVETLSNSIHEFSTSATKVSKRIQTLTQGGQDSYDHNH